MTKFLMVEDVDAEMIARLAKLLEEVGKKEKIRLYPVAPGTLKRAIQEILRLIYAGDPGITQQGIRPGETFRVIHTNEHGYKTSFRIKIVQERSPPSE